MSVKLYVGNLSFSTTSEELQQLFAQAGKVESATVVEDRDTGRSRGFGFVEIASKEEGQKAIEQFNGTDLNGRNLIVNGARPREDRGNRAGGRGLAAIAAAGMVAAAPVVAATTARLVDNARAINHDSLFTITDALKGGLWRNRLTRLGIA